MQNISTDNVQTDGNSVTFTGREAVNAYAFLTLRKAVQFRIKHGMSLMRGQEALMARNYGWSNRARFSAKLLDDLNAVGDAAGIKR